MSARGWLKERETDCGVCGVPAFCMVPVCEGYAVPRCEDHLDSPAYQAEYRLYALLDPPPTTSGVGR